MWLTRSRTLLPFLCPALVLGGCLDWSSSDGTARGDAGRDGAVQDGAALPDPTPDASGGAPDSGSALPSDAGLVDGAAAGGPVADGAAPGADDAASERAFCETVSKSTPCADFDSTSLDDWSWPELTPTPGTALTVVDEGPTAGDHVLRATVGAQADDTAMAAFELPVDVASFDLAFDLRANVPTPTSGVTLFMKLQEDVGDDYPGVSLGLSATGPFIGVENSVGGQVSWDPHDLPPLPVGWTRVRIRGQLGADGSLSVQYGDASPTVFEHLRIASDPAKKAALKLGLYSQAGAPGAAWFDDALLTYTRRSQ